MSKKLINIYYNKNKLLIAILRRSNLFCSIMDYTAFHERKQKASRHSVNY